jgi:hypothetical protein
MKQLLYQRQSFVGSRFQKYFKRAELLQYCPAKIRQMLVSIVSVYYPKACRTTGHSLCIVEYHRKITIIIISELNLFSEALAWDICWVCDFSSCQFRRCLLRFSIVFSFQATKSSSPGLELSTIFRNFDICKTSFFSQGTSLVPSLMSVRGSLVEIEDDLLTHTFISLYEIKEHLQRNSCGGLNS